LPRSKSKSASCKSHSGSITFRSDSLNAIQSWTEVRMQTFEHWHRRCNYRAHYFPDRTIPYRRGKCPSKRWHGGIWHCTKRTSL
jgi:hypothetical protein